MTDLLQRRRRALFAWAGAALLGALAILASERLEPALLKWLTGEPAAMRSRVALLFGIMGAAIALPLIGMSAWAWQRGREQRALRVLALALAVAAVAAALLLLALYRLL